jgi:hypothetical protein
MDESLSKLDAIEARHTNISRDGDELSYCVGCERGPWPCREKRLAKALRLALEGLPCSISPAVKEDPCPCYDCRIRAAALSALDQA